VVAVQVLDAMVAAAVATTPQVLPVLVAVVVVAVAAVVTLQLEARVAQVWAVAQTLRQHGTP
jgi:hypothetical protein